MPVSDVGAVEIPFPQVANCQAALEIRNEILVSCSREHFFYISLVLLSNSFLPVINTLML